MKKIILFIFLVIITIQSKGMDQPIRYSEKGKYGLMVRMGERGQKKITKAKYDSISSFFGEYAVIWKDHKAGLIDKNGREIIKCKYEDIKEGVYSLNQSKDRPIVWVRTNGKYMQSDGKLEYSETQYRDILAAPDKEMYGESIDSPNTWISLKDRNNVIYATKDEIKGVQIKEGFYYFNSAVYDDKGNLISTIGKDWKKIPIEGEEYIFDGYKLLTLSKGNYVVNRKIGERDLSNINGRYKKGSAFPSIYIYNNRVYSMSSFPWNKNFTLLTDKNNKKGIIAADNSVIIPISFSDISYKTVYFGAGEAAVLTINLIPGMDKNIGIDSSKQKDDKFLNFTEIFDNINEHINLPLIIYVKNLSGSKGILAVGLSECDYILENVEDVAFKDDLIWVTIDNMTTPYDGSGKSIISGADSYSSMVITDEYEQVYYDSGKIKKVPIRSVYYSFTKDGKKQYAQNRYTVELLEKEEIEMLNENGIY